MKIDQTNYCSFLLRMWRVTDDGYCWRVSLENVMTGEQRGFPSIDALIAFLDEMTRAHQRDQDLAQQTE